MDFLTLLPPPACAQEGRAFRVPGTDKTIELAFRVVPGVALDSRLAELAQQLLRAHGDGGTPVSLPGQPPITLSEQVCEWLALLLVYQCPPIVPLVQQNGAMVDVAGLEWKPKGLQDWVALITRSTPLFDSVLHFIRLLEARAEGYPVYRVAVAKAYQEDIPDGLSPDDPVEPSLDGLTGPAKDVPLGNE